MNSTSLASQILWPVFFSFALVCALAGAVVSVGLIAAQGTTLRFFSWINTWIPMRTHTRWAEVPHDTGRLVLAWRNWFATAFILGGAFILISVVGYLALARPPVPRTEFMASLLLEMLIWLMVAGGVLAIGVGLMLALAPAVLTRIEEQTDRWVSTRKSGRTMAEVGDHMHLGFDQFIVRHARSAGCILLALSVTGASLTAWALVTR
jgi:hypothetical protein